MEYINRLKEQMENGPRRFSKKYIDRCLAYASNLIEKDLPVIFDIKHLSKLMGIKYSILSHYIANTEYLYSEFSIPKRNGGYRTIDSPSLNLKKIQRWILDNILVYLEVSPCATGFKRNSNILVNAKHHIDKNVVYTIDIKDFFPNISDEKIYFLFYNLGYSSEIAYALTNLLTYEGHLPQGSPCSPILSNIYCKEMDDSLQKIADRFNFSYSRYADDMTFSSNDVSSLISKTDTVKKTLAFFGFELNQGKERIQYQNQTQMVTGLIVNKGVKVRRVFKKEVEKHIYFCEKYGVYNHLQKIGMSEKSFFKEYLYGKVHFIYSIEPDIGKRYLERLDKINWSY